MKRKRLLIFLLFTSVFLSRSAFANENSIDEARASFISECLLSNIEDPRHSFISLFNDIKNKVYDEISVGSSAELLVGIAGLMPPDESQVRYLGSNTQCFKDYLSKISSFYGMGEDIFSNNLIISSPGVREEIAQLTKNTRMYFLVVYDPVKTQSNGISWSQMWGTTIFSFATSFENLKQNSATQIQLVKEIERQYVHEQYVKHDVIQLLASGYLHRLPVSKSLIQLEGTLKLNEIELLNDLQVKFSFSNYRALQFEISKGFRHELIPNMKCSDIVKKYSMEPINSILIGYKARSRANIFAWSLGARNGQITDLNHKLNYEDLDQNPQLCRALKTPYYLDGSMLPVGTDGPGCSGCIGGWLQDQKIREPQP
ncbi:MAG: hypothetical protein ACXVCY_05935 [Pseudobdellovibrionaceae bacterium]